MVIAHVHYEVRYACLNHHRLLWFNLMVDEYNSNSSTHNRDSLYNPNDVMYYIIIIAVPFQVSLVAKQIL